MYPENLNSPSHASPFSPPRSAPHGLAYQKNPMQQRNRQPSFWSLFFFASLMALFYFTICPEFRVGSQSRRSRANTLLKSPIAWRSSLYQSFTESRNLWRSSLPARKSQRIGSNDRRYASTNRVSSASQSFGDPPRLNASFGSNGNFGNLREKITNYDKPGLVGNHSWQPPKKNSPPKYGNCDDDVVNTSTGPCYGYYLPSSGGAAPAITGSGPNGSTTIDPQGYAPTTPYYTSAPATLPTSDKSDVPLRSSPTQTPSLSASDLPSVLVEGNNILQLEVNVLQSSDEPHNIPQHLAGVMNSVLNVSTPFLVYPSNYTFQRQDDHHDICIMLIQNPNASDVIVLKDPSSTMPWRQYEVGYRCFQHPSNLPILNATLLKDIFSVCMNAIDASILSGEFLRQLKATANERHVDVLNVAIPGSDNELGGSTTSSASPRTFPLPLSTNGLDLRGFVGLAMVTAIVGITVTLTFLGAKRELKIKQDELWGFALASEQDVGNLLNLGFMWQQGEGHEGPPKGVIVFNKQRIGYTDDMLIGGFHNPNFLLNLVDTTLPSSGASDTANTLLITDQERPKSLLVSEQNDLLPSFDDDDCFRPQGG